jgi:hypothetical protein
MTSLPPPVTPAPLSSSSPTSSSPSASFVPSSPKVARHDRYDYGTYEDVGWVTRLLWFCAGADAQLLVRCPQSDRVKFQGLGGVVATVGILAFFSGSYAFYTVFSPKEATALGERMVHWPSVGMSMFFGLVWAAIIFNIDRFIISSTGKGDGTDKITLEEFTNALPRLAMALIIGLCLSKPLEIKILQSEIESALERNQKEFLLELNEKSEALVAQERGALREKIDTMQKRIDDNAGELEKRRLEINQQRKALELEAEGRTGSGVAGRGPAWRDKSDNLERMQAELDRDRENLGKKNALVEDELKEAKTALAALDSRIAGEKASNLQVARHLDGLMKRIQISHEIGGSIPIAIMLLLLCIEMGPIFFKLMVTKGAYDYLKENQKRLVKAKAGIESDARIVSDGKGKSYHVDVHHAANAVLEEEKRRLATERLLAEKVHAEWQKRQAAAIAENPQDFVAPPSSSSPSPS